MSVLNHSIICLKECKLEVQSTNYVQLYNNSNLTHQGIGLAVLGDRVVTSLFINSLACDDTTHHIDSIPNAIPVYPFPSFGKQKDLFVFDFSQLVVSNSYDQTLISQLIPSVCSVLVVSIPFHSNKDDYSTDLEVVQFLVNKYSSLSVILLHYNIPPDQCDWEYEKSTLHFSIMLPEFYNTIKENSSYFKVIDIPTMVVNRSNISVPLPRISEVEQKKGYLNISSFLSKESSLPSEERVLKVSSYMTQCLECISVLLNTVHTQYNSKQLISRIHVICSLLNDNQIISSSAIQKRILDSCHLPSSFIQSLFLSLWKVLSPNPSVSLSQPFFGNDYYLRFQDRLLLCEDLCLMSIADHLSPLLLDAMSSQSSFSFFRDIYKVIHSNILAILPCSTAVSIHLDNNPYNISHIENRGYFRHEEKETVQLHCITPQVYHDKHYSVFPVESQSWYRHSNNQFSWKGDYQQASLRHFDRDEYTERLRRYAHYRKSERLIPLTTIKSAHSSSRQEIHLCRERDLPQEQLNCIVCPLCVYCWKKIITAESRNHAFLVDSREGQYYSQNEDKWFCEHVYLVQCDHCAEHSGNERFHAKLFPFCVDGVPSLYLSSSQCFQVCPLCSRFVVPSCFKEKLTAQKHNISQVSHGKTNEQSKRMVDIIHYMNSKLKRIVDDSEESFFVCCIIYIWSSWFHMCGLVIILSGWCFFFLYASRKSRISL